jgi:uncharacterized protein
MKNEFLMSQIIKSKELDINLDENTPWLKSLLDELCEGLTNNDYQQGEELPCISFVGELKSDEDDKYKDYATLIGTLEITYYTLCARSGTVILDYLDASVEAAFLNSSLKEALGLEEDVDIFLTDRAYELYFHEKGKLDIKPVLSEYAYVNKNPYPALES